MEDKPVKVRKNLWWALQYLQRGHDQRVLWIDALCYDQADISERNHQVRHMNQIYSAATTVLVWLGRETADCDAAFNRISACNEASLQSEAHNDLAKYSYMP